MIEFSGQGILLDIEGTTSAVSYVYDVLFPYARKEIGTFLETHWCEPDVISACELMARDAGKPSIKAWLGEHATREEAVSTVAKAVYALMDVDAKATGLKELQGLIWRQGFQKGDIGAHVYPDVPAALAAWCAAGVDVRIFSSGSVAAQRLLFANSEHGDLGKYIKGHYDTRTGPKRQPSSYTAIAADMQIEAGEILFLSDLVEELDAAQAAGLKTALVVRPGNPPPPPDHEHPVVRDLAAVKLTRQRSW